MISAVETPFVAMDDASMQPPRSATRRSLILVTACAIVGVLTWALLPQRAPATKVSLPGAVLASLKPPDAKRRCEHVIHELTSRDAGKPDSLLKERYKAFVSDASSFYRGTAALFWKDFVQLGWGRFDLTTLGVESKLGDGSPLQRTSTWTWVTGDQHLSNFGAWQNRHGDVVFGMNDFDEASIYDFQMDVWRLAVSVYSHALHSGLDEEKAAAAVLTLCDSYLTTITGYIGNERALTYEVTEKTATGPLAVFLRDVSAKASHHKQLQRFTEMGPDGKRRFVLDAKTKLEGVSPAFAAEVKRALGGLAYGATMMKIGWHAKLWDPSSGSGDFEVLDVAARVGSGVGSYGVGRYYVLLAGRNAQGVDESDEFEYEDKGVILDVKFEPAPAALSVFSTYDTAWCARSRACCRASHHPAPGSHRLASLTGRGSSLPVGHDAGTARSSPTTRSVRCAASARSRRTPTRTPAGRSSTARRTWCGSARRGRLPSTSTACAPTRTSPTM